MFMDFSVLLIISYYLLSRVPTLGNCVIVLYVMNVTMSVSIGLYPKLDLRVANKLHYIMLRYVMLRYVTLRHITSHYITLHHITSHYITLHYITLIITLRALFIIRSQIGQIVRNPYTFQL
jgi:hypothetical protein